MAPNDTTREGRAIPSRHHRTCGVRCWPPRPSRRAAPRLLAALAVRDASGAAVPAEFRVLSRWNAGLADANAPLHSVLVEFPAAVVVEGTYGHPPEGAVTPGALAVDLVEDGTGLASRTWRPRSR